MTQRTATGLSSGVRAAVGPHRHRGSTIVFATRHGKQHQAAGPFRELLDARVVAPDDLDTDRFGSFTGEVPCMRMPRCCAT